MYMQKLITLHQRTYVNEECGHYDAKNTKRPFGGLNVVASGDAWQFGPIGSSGAVFDNPLKLKKCSSVEQMSTMFWTKGIDSFNGF